MMIGYRGSTQKCSSVPIVLMQQLLGILDRASRIKVRASGMRC